MNNTHLIISEVRKQTDEVILFHSLTGKDSIVLLELLSSKFSKVLCCFMYVVNNLELTTKYKKFIETKYSNVELIAVPSYEVYSIVKNGAYGVKKDPKQKLYTLADITAIIKKTHGIEWAIFGVKMNDSMNRRLMLKGYRLNGINDKTKNAYPLAEWNNKMCHAFISRHKLIKPLSYDKKQSSGIAIHDGAFLHYLKENYPTDLQKIFSEFPLTKIYLYEYESKIQSERNSND